MVPADIVSDRRCRAASTIEELLSLHDETFIRCAYESVLGRDPDPEGLSHFLARIRAGHSRHAILAAIRLSPEGRGRESVLPGLDRSIAYYRWKHMPLIGSILRWFGIGRDRLDILRQIATIENQIDRLTNLLDSHKVAKEPVDVLTTGAEEGQINTNTELDLESLPPVVALAGFDKNDVKPKKFRVGWVTTWNVKCGIATHVEHLLASLSADAFVIFAGRQAPQIRADEPNCFRIWNLGKSDNSLHEISAELEPLSIGALVIQFNYGFFNHFELNDFIESLVASGIVVIIDLHSTVDPFGEKENYRLTDFLAALRKCHRILAHGPADLARLKELGLVDNVILFPLGVMNRGYELRLPAKHSTPPLIASFGYCLPNKGLLELLKAVSLLKREGKLVRLLMLNAEHPAPESAAEVERINREIKFLGLQDEVEMRSEFIENDACLALLGAADLIVNPYQHTGESASASVRYGLAAGRPVAVTPLPIFEDLGDAVFRMSGTAPHEIAQGITSTLAHLAEGSASAKLVQYAAREWLNSHDYSRQCATLMRISRTFAQPKKVLRGAFINPAQANCSIYESGRMVYGCLEESENYCLDYFSLDMFDLPLFAKEGTIKLLDEYRVVRSDDPAEYDFWVFNWHFITMEPHLSLKSISRLPGVKFSIILELEPGDPLKLVHSDVFDGYIALDPTTPAVGKIFPFPRPLEGDLCNPKLPRDVPVIGSFGFGTPGKGFELLVEAVNREFDKAIVRVNIPKGAYTASMDSIHLEEYSKYIESLCMKIAKPGIDVRFTNAFMSPEELVDWCADNDLNCFMYTRRQSGLSATTDQAIMSGRPLVTGSNDTFRHIQSYIPPYPITTLREAIRNTVPLVRKMQQDWSRKSFGNTFEHMLVSFGLLTKVETVGHTPTSRKDSRPIVVVASRLQGCTDDIRSYSTRLANCLKRSGMYDVRQLSFSKLSDLVAQLTTVEHAAMIFADFFDGGPLAFATALKHVVGPKIFLVDESEGRDVEILQKMDGLVVIGRPPIIPYYTPPVVGPKEPLSIMLVGFASQASNLEAVIAKISRELPYAHVFLEVPDSNKLEFEARIARIAEHPQQINNKRFEVVSLAVDSDKMILSFVESRLIVFYNDASRTAELENVSALAMTTERAIAFTRAAPFVCFMDGGTYVEDLAISDIISLGMGAQIKLCHEFGEGQFYAMIERLLSKKFADARTMVLPKVEVTNQ
jgi:glycosyltransferase involved in cell wall biosynthesis